MWSQGKVILLFFIKCLLIWTIYRREDREHLARKTNLWDNLEDTFKAGFANSDPGVRTFDRIPVCSRCNSSGDHWTMGCPTKVAPSLTDSDDLLVVSFFCKVDEQPEEQVDLAQKLFVT